MNDQQKKGLKMDHVVFICLSNSFEYFNTPLILESKNLAHP